MPCAFLDVSIGSSQCGRIVVQLYEDRAPLATSRFLENLPKLKDTYFHRVIKNFMIQGGDLEFGKAENYGSERVGTGTSASPFEDENLSEKIDGPFKLCMANSGPNTNGTQFFILTYPAPHLDGKHTVFGRVIHGKSVVRDIERVSTNKANLPLKDELPIITDSGEWSEGDPVPIYNACYDQVGGDIYEEYPDDDENIDKELFKPALDAATIIKNSGGELFKKGEVQKAFLKYRKSLRYVMEFMPDEDLEPELYSQFIDLKKKLYLNLSLVCLKLQNFSRCVDYGTFLLDMKLTEAEKAKTLYRMGSAQTGLKKYEEAIKLLGEAKKILADAGILKELSRAEELQEAAKKREKAKYAKFFG